MNGGAALSHAVRTLFHEGQTDYSLEPIVLVDAENQPIGCIADGDAVIFCCRRGEREIELTEAFTEKDFSHFPRQDFQNLCFVILTLYHEKFRNLPVAFAPAKIENSLGEVISKAGLRQLRTAESEKFAHVTFFLNGGHVQPFPGEDDISIPSPKGVPFDQVPELSLSRVADEVLCGIEQEHDLIVTNFANGDVIGHSSNCAAKIRCAQEVDHHLGRITEAALAAGYVVMITADHGNLEELWSSDGRPHVAHTTNPVPFVLLDSHTDSLLQPRNGCLADIAPTILSAMGVPQPAVMSGATLAPDHPWGGHRRVMLVILDGWGIGRADNSNPVYLGPAPYWEELTKRHPCSRLMASGDAVGLQAGKPGNSEAGHMNIGAGRVVVQDDVRLDRAMSDGSFYRNEVFLKTIGDVKKSGGHLHLIGLLSEKSSHGSLDYPLALLEMAKAQGLGEVFIHVIFDGRSTEPGSAPALLDKLAAQVAEIGVGRIVTGVGRGIALDRDRNYGKVKRAYDALVWGTGRQFPLGVDLVVNAPSAGKL